MGDGRLEGVVIVWFCYFCSDVTIEFHKPLSAGTNTRLISESNSFKDPFGVELLVRLIGGAQWTLSRVCESEGLHPGE